MRNLNPNPALVAKRVALLEALRVQFGLQKLLDYGHNPMLYESLNYPQLQVIEIDPEVTGDEVITGAYLTALPDHLTSDTCYTAFVFLNPYGANLVNEEKLKAEFVQIKSLLMGAGLKNSFLVLWVRSRDFQDYRVYDLENQLDITDSFLGVA